MTSIAQSALQRDPDLQKTSTKTLGHKLAVGVGFAAAVFHIYTGATAPLPAMQHRVVHLVMGLVMAFLLFRATKRHTGRVAGRMLQALDYVLIGLSLGTGAFLFINSNALLIKLNPDTTDVIVAIILVVLVLEATRRTTGLVLPIIGVIAILYGIFGDRLSGLFQHSGSTIPQIARHLALSTEGILGVALGVSATYVILFVLFGSLLQMSGAGELMLKMAQTSVGRYRGGAAKGATVASALFGSISGSPVGNVAATGPVTIPMMVSTGFKPKTAAAIEATASTGGMILPPVMGASAFLIAELLAIPYSQVALAALVPALLYYVAVLFTIDFYAARHGLKGTKVDRALHAFGVLVYKRGYQLIPLAILIYMLAVAGTTAGRAAYWGLVSAAIIALLAAILKKGLRQFPIELIKTLADSFRSMIVIIMACATAGIVMGMMSVTGLGFRLSFILTEIAGSNIVALLLLTMVASIVLGMSLPAVAAYLVLAVTVAPALVDLGIMPLAAHLFVLYFGVLSNITPPVALAPFTAAGIAMSKPQETSFEAVKFAISGFVIPFVLVFSPGLMLSGTLTEIVIAVSTTTLGMIALSAVVTGYLGGNLTFIWRALLLIAAIALIVPDLSAGIAGTVAVAVIYFKNFITNNKKE